MTTNADSEAEAPERFEPTSMQGQMIEAEHLVRYSWARQFAARARVLDAGCGVGYGSALLADAGAREVVAVDKDKSIAADVESSMPPNVAVEVGDVTQLEHPADSFDLVVCFEVIEHVPEPDAVLDELHRVLRPGGLLVVSTPNRDVYTPGNPYHLRELTPPELEAKLAHRFRQVRLRRQHTWIASGVLDDTQFATADNGALDPLELRKAVGDQPGRETYTIGLASDGELPPDRGSVSLTADVDLRRWSELWHEQRRAIEHLSGPQAEINELRQQLIESEFALRRMATLEARIAELAGLLEWHQKLINSYSWRLMQPVRRVTGLARTGKQRIVARAREEVVAARTRK